MLLHLAEDSVFINSARDLFEAAAPGNNIFLIIKQEPASPCRYVRPRPETLIVPWEGPKTVAYIDGMDNVDAIVLHSLTSFAVETLNFIKRRIPILWLAWGYDVYEATPSLQWHLYQPRTLRYVSRRRPYRTSWYCALLVKCLLQYLGIHRNRNYRLHSRAVKKCTFCAPVFPTENDIIRKHCGFEGQFLRFIYPDYVDEVDPNPPDWKKARDVMVGNSSTPSSNHLDAFEMLSRLDLGGRKVVVPLSYGNPDYRNYVVRAGKSMFGKSFVPLFDFMPMKEYSSLIKTCGVCIFNHGRQQAGGNILMGLWHGARVCLTEQNAAYHYFSSLGATIFSIKRDLTNHLLEHPLDESVAMKNRAVVRQEYGREAVLHHVEQVVCTLLAAARDIQASREDCS